MDYSELRKKSAYIRTLILNAIVSSPIYCIGYLAMRYYSYSPRLQIKQSTRMKNGYYFYSIHPELINNSVSFVKNLSNIFIRYLWNFSTNLREQGQIFHRFNNIFNQRTGIMGRIFGNVGYYVFKISQALWRSDYGNHFSNCSLAFL